MTESDRLSTEEEDYLIALCAHLPEARQYEDAGRQWGIDRGLSETEALQHAEVLANRGLVKIKKFLGNEYTLSVTSEGRRFAEQLVEERKLASRVKRHGSALAKWSGGQFLTLFIGFVGGVLGSFAAEVGKVLWQRFFSKS